ncbi:nudC domain-containing protein 3 isoform X2 [Drosophila tropicalis]
MRDQLVFGAMQRYDPDGWGSAGIQNAEAEYNGTTVPPAIEEITINTEETTESDMKSNPFTFSPSDYKNGASFDTYCWSQSQKDLEVHVKLPSDLKAAKRLSVDIKPQFIKISGKLKPDQQIILEGNLIQRIKHNEAVWTIDHDTLIISCDKTKELWWERLFKGEPEIDTSKLDCERYIDELPEDSQVAIEKLRFQQLASDQKKQLQSPEQTKTMERLKIAWDAEGSPFKGQPFDPSIVQMS